MWVRIPVELGEALWSHVLAKGAGHKYVKRVPYTKKNGKKGYRYYYKVQHGGGVHHEDHFEEGAAFRYQGGHYHITSVDGDTLTVRHDETGKVQKVSRSRLRALLGTEHAKEISAYRSRLREDLEAAQRYGSPKQLARLLQQADKWGVSTATYMPVLAGDDKQPQLPTDEQLSSALAQAGNYTPEQLKALAVFGSVARRIAEQSTEAKEILEKPATQADKTRTKKELEKAKDQAVKDIERGKRWAGEKHEEWGEHREGAARDIEKQASDKQKFKKLKVDKASIFGGFTLHDHVARGGTVGAWHVKNWVVSIIPKKPSKMELTESAKKELGGFDASTVTSSDMYAEMATYVAKSLDKCLTVSDCEQAIEELKNFGLVEVEKGDPAPEGHIKMGRKLAGSYTDDTGRLRSRINDVYVSAPSLLKRAAFGGRFEGFLRGAKLSKPYYSTLSDAKRMERDGRSAEDYIKQKAKDAGYMVKHQDRVYSRTGGTDVPGVTSGKVTTAGIGKHFGLNNIDFGKSVPYGERDEHLRRFAGAMHDLSEVIGIPASKLGGNGRLAIAFGARGRGTADAHYEPSNRIVNLTRFAGGGSLAHEWGHAIDHMIGHGGKVARNHSHMASTSPFHLPSGSATKRSLDALDNALRSSDFVRDAQALDGAKKRAYFASRHEMFARLFEAYTHDSLAKQGRGNSYLVSDTKELRPTGLMIPVSKSEIHDKDPKAQRLFSELGKARVAAYSAKTSAEYPALAKKHIAKRTEYNEYMAEARKRFPDREAQLYPQGKDRETLVRLMGDVVSAIRKDGLLDNVAKSFFAKAGTYKVPSAVSAAARRGLEYRRRAGGKGGLTVAQASAQRYWDGYFTPRPGIDVIIKADDRPTGGGWQPIPGGKHGGYRKKAGKGYTYWYPSSAHAAKAAKHHKKKGERMRKRLERVLRKRGAKQSDIEKFLDQYDHHSGAGHGAHTMSRSGDEEAKTEETGKEETKTEGASDKTRGNLLQALKDHHGLSDEQAEEVAARLDTEQKKRKSKSALESALKEHHGLSDEQVGQVMKQLGTMLANRKEKPKKEEPKKKAPKKEAPKKEAPKKEAPKASETLKKKDAKKAAFVFRQIKDMPEKMRNDAMSAVKGKMSAESYAELERLVAGGKSEAVDAMQAKRDAKRDKRARKTAAAIARGKARAAKKNAKALKPGSFSFKKTGDGYAATGALKGRASIKKRGKKWSVVLDGKEHPVDHPKPSFDHAEGLIREKLKEKTSR